MKSAVHGFHFTEMWKRLQKHQTQLLLCLLGFSFGITIRIHRNYLVEKCNYEESLHPRSGSFVDMIPDEEPVSGNRKLVNIGVMSAQKFLMRRTRDIAESWAIDVSNSESGGKVTVFSDNPEKIKFDHLNIVTLQGVNDNMYPPQRKSYSVIRHFHDLELNNFDWFMRLDDDVYLNFPRVESFLKKLDPSKPLMIGNAGMGRDPDDYVPKEMTYCMGGTGIIFSREAIKQIRPHLHKCLKEEIYSEHEDIELGG